MDILTTNLCVCIWSILKKFGQIWWIHHHQNPSEEGCTGLTTQRPICFNALSSTAARHCCSHWGCLSAHGMSSCPFISLFEIKFIRAIIMYFTFLSRRLLCYRWLKKMVQLGIWVTWRQSWKRCPCPLNVRWSVKDCWLSAKFPPDFEIPFTSATGRIPGMVRVLHGGVLPLRHEKQRSSNPGK